MKIAKLTLFLALISALAGSILAYVNNLTAPLIADQGHAAEKINLEIIFPESEFTTISYEDETGLIQDVYEAKTKGYVFKVEVIGYNASNPIVFMIGYNLDGEIVGFEVLNQQETNGLGSRIADLEFQENLIGKKNGDSIDDLSGATVTSKAVIQGIHAATKLFVKITGSEMMSQTGNTTTLQNDFVANKAEIVKEESGVYTVSAKGYEGDNIYEIHVVDGSIISIKMIEFNDTVGIGDAVDELYLNSFVNGIQVTEKDTLSGATYTSRSALAAIELVLSTIAVKE